MTIQTIITNAKKSLQSNSPQVFTGMSILGVVTTAYLTGRASYKAALLIDADERLTGTHGDRKERFKERGKLTWKLYIPPAASAVATIGCICGLSHVTSRRATAAATAYAVAERSFSEYKEKVEEEFGKGKEQKIRDSIAQDKVDGSSSEVVMFGSGLVLCCELYTSRYLRSDKETINRAVNEINQRIHTDLYVMVSEFYDLIGMQHTSQSDYIGWESKEMSLCWTTTESLNGEPCLAFDYNYIKPLN